MTDRDRPPGERDETDDPPAFEALMGAVDHAMVIVTTAVDDARAGCLVGFHSQCGIDPPRYAVWLSKANQTFRVAARAETFAVHVPRRDDLELARLFGGKTGDDIDKFERCAWTAGPDGVPLLDDCEDRFVGRRVDLVEVVADHACLVLAPTAAGRGEGHDWLTFWGSRQIEAGHPPDR